MTAIDPHKCAVEVVLLKASLCSYHQFLASPEPFHRLACNQILGHQTLVELLEVFLLPSFQDLYIS